MGSVLGYKTEDIVHERHILARQEGAVVTIFDLLIMEDCRYSVACPSTVDCVGEGVLFSYEHGNWDVLQSGDIDNRGLFLAVVFHVCSALLEVIFLEFAAVD